MYQYQYLKEYKKQKKYSIRNKRIIIHYKCFMHNYSTITKKMYLLHIMNNNCFICYLKNK